MSEPFNVLVDTAHGPMLVNKHDIYVGGSFLAYGEFSHGETALFEQLIKPGMVVVNAGANLGAHTIRLAQLCAPGTCYAFEPQKFAFELLVANVALNSLMNVIPVRTAVGDGDIVTVPMLDPRVRQNFGGLELTRAFGEGEQWVASPLDLLKLERLDLLFADVEGAELSVLCGARETIDRCLPMLYVEADRKEKQADLLTYLTDELGYDAYWHTPPLFRPDNFKQNPENIFGDVVSMNWFCVPQGRQMHPTWQQVTKEGIAA